MVGESKRKTANDVLNVLENRMWCPVWSTAHPRQIFERRSTAAVAFAITEVPWLNGLVTAAWGLIVFSMRGCNPRRGLFARELEVMQARVNAAFGQQLGVIPALDNLSIVHHENYIGGTDGREVMCDHD